MRNLFLIGISHKEFDLENSISCVIADKIADFQNSVMANKNIYEFVLLNTCNRLEFYYVANEDCSEFIFETYQNYGVRIDIFKQRAYILKNEEALKHIFEVASGLESQLRGETEILGQIKNAYKKAFDKNQCGNILNTSFQKTMQYAKWVRSNTHIGKGKISIGTVSAQLANRIFEDLKLVNILMIGSGEVGELVVSALKAKGALNINITARNFEKVKLLADKFNANAIALNECMQNLEHYDIIITASSSKDILINKDIVDKALVKRKNKSMFLIDLAIPNNIDKACQELEEAYLYNFADLSEISNNNLKNRLSDIELAKKYISEKALDLSKRLFSCE